MRVRRNIGRAVIVGVILVGQAAAVGAGGSASPPQAPAVGPLNGPQNPATPAYQVEWIANTVPTLMEAGRDHTASLTIRNSGTEPWSAGTLVATYRWDATQTANAGQFASLSLPTVLSVAVPSGQEVTLDRVRIRPPATPGPYTLTFILDDGRRSFEKSGTTALSVGVTVAPQGGALTDAGYKVAWTAIDIPKTMASGSDHFGRIVFRNISPELWPAGTVLASYHWYGSGAMLPDLAPQTRIPFPIPPGQEAQVDNLLILPPRQPGNYELQVTLVDQTAWFETKGADTVTVPVTVTPGRESAGPFIDEEIARPISLVLWVILGVLLAGAVVASRVSTRPLAHALLCAAAVTAVLLSTVPVLSAPVQHLALQPFPDAPQYADAARHIAQGKGYVTTIHGTDPVTPMHSPGFSALLAPFTAIGDYPRNIQTAVQWFAVAYVGAAALLAWQLAGPLAAVFAAVILAISPFARISGTVVLSDLFAVLLVLIVVMTLVTRISPWRAFTAGLIAGILVCVRLNMVTALLPLIVIVPRRHWKTLALGAVPPLAALALFQWLTWGSPLTTGYDVWVPDLKMFDLAYATAPAPRIGQGNVWLFPDRLGGGLMEWVCPCPPGGPQAALSNLWFYPAAVFGALWVFTPPLIPVIGLAYTWRHRKEPTARYALLLTALTIGVHTFYYTQEVRFAAAPATLLGIYGAVAGARAFRRRSAMAAEDEAALAAPVVYQRREPAPAVPVPERAGGAWSGSAVGAERVRRSFRLSVIVPVFNERLVVGASLRRLLALEHDLINALEVIVVDDGSTDGTREVLEELADRDPRIVLVCHPQNRGKGAAVRTGIDHANGDITMIHDADLEYHPEDIPALLVPFQREGADAVFGSRYLSSPYRRALRHRHTMMNRTLTFVSNWFTDLNLTDLESCYKAVNTTLLKSIPLRSDDFRIEVEVPFKLAKRGARIYEVPIRYSPRTRHEGKKIRARDGILALRGMVHFAVVDDLYKRDEPGMPDSSRPAAC
jgi:hypothetical protein